MDCRAPGTSRLACDGISLALARGRQQLSTNSPVAANSGYEQSKCRAGLVNGVNRLTPQEKARLASRPTDWNTGRRYGLDEADPGAVKDREETVRREFWAKLKRTAARSPFARDMVAAYYCALDPATPFRAKAVLVGALAYFILPFDIIPDFIIGLGYTDDAAALALAIKMVADNLKPEHREAADRALAGDGPKA